MTVETARPEADEQPRAKVFISYSRKDQAFAGRLEAALKQRGFEPLIDREDIYAFEEWWTRIESLVAQADTVVFVLSPDSVCSEVALREVSFAASLNKRFAPIVVRNVDAALVPEPLAKLNFIFFDDATQFDPSADQLAQALETDIAWIRRHTEFGEQARRWVSVDRPGGLLLRSPLLEHAERWIASRPPGAPTAPPETQAFITQSRRGATQRRNVLTGGLAAGLLLALGLAALAYWQRGVAQRNEVQAMMQRDAALVTQSRFLSDLAQQRIARGDGASAVLLALEALPDRTEGVERPQVVEAEAALFKGRSHLRELRVLYGHGAAVTSAVFSADGARVLTASADGSARIWELATGKTLMKLQSDKGALASAAFGLDGTRVLTVTAGGTAQLWDIDSGKVIFALRGDDEAQTNDGAVGPRRLRAAFTPGGKRILTARGGDTDLWDSKSGGLVATLKGYTPAREAFSRDGERVITIDKASVRLWDTATGNHVRDFDAPLKKVYEGPGYLTFEGEGVTPDVAGAALSASGGIVATWYGDPFLRLWSARTGEELMALFQDHDERYVFAPDGILIGISRDHDLRLYTFPTVGGADYREYRERNFKLLRSMSGHEAEVTDLAFSPDGTLLVSVSADKTTRLWDFNSDRLINNQSRRPIVFAGHPDDILGAAFSPDGKTIVTASADQTSRLWKIEALPRVVAFGAEELASVPLLKRAYRIIFSPDGRYLMSISQEAMRLSDAETGKDLWEVQAHGSPFGGTFSPDSRQFVTWSVDQTARIWDVGTGREIAVLRGHEGGVFNAAFSPDAGRLVTTSLDHTARVWNTRTGAELLVLRGHADRLNIVSFSPDGRRIATTSNDATVRIWDADSGRELLVLRGHAAPVYVASFANDGHRILTSSYDGTARVWDVDSGEELMALSHRRSEGYPNSLTFRPAYSRDGTRIVTAGIRGAQVWDARSGQLVTSFGNDRELDNAVFSNDGRSLMVASEGQIQIWDLARETPVLTLDDEAKALRHGTMSPDGSKVAASDEVTLLRVWRMSDDRQALIAQSKSLVPRCLTRKQLIAAFLEPEPPLWCIETNRWPYHTNDWKTWLKYKRANADPPLPDSPRWQTWLRAQPSR